MSRALTSLLSLGGLTFALAACGDTSEAPIEAEAEQVAIPEYDPMTRDYNLSTDAQTRRASFDSATFERDYAGYRDEIIAEQDTEESMASEREGDNMADGGTDPMRMPERDESTNMRARKDMNWRYLDRNDDNELTIAEYAIWAIPLDPSREVVNDEGAPYLTADEINKAADSFYYYDLNGDGTLSRREFTAARRGENFDPQETA